MVHHETAASSPVAQILLFYTSLESAIRWHFVSHSFRSKGLVGFFKRENERERKNK